MLNIGMERAVGIPMLQTEITAHSILYEIIRYQVPTYYVPDSDPGPDPQPFNKSGSG